MRLKVFHLFVITIVINSLLFAQTANLDWKITNTSAVRQVIDNLGTLEGHPTELNYSGLIMCEFPANSYEEHHGEGGIWIGAITPDDDTLVTSTISWASSPFWETYPSAEPWDTIWSVKKGETQDIPYWPNYTGKSDEDFVMRYNDYGPISLKDQRHKPLFLEFIQTTYTYASPATLNEVIIHQYFVMPQKIKLENAYVGIWLDPNVGNIENGSNYTDDRSLFFNDLKLAVGEDGEGGNDGTAYSPIGIMAIPPKDVNQNLLKWTWSWGSDPYAPGMIPSTDPEKYRNLMAAGGIMENQQQPTGSHFLLAFGPFDLNPGDTLKFGMAEVFGEGLEGLVANAKSLQLIIERDFVVPSAPPVPRVTIETSNKQIKLNWQPTEDNNPESYQDSARGDNSKQPFEGYRIYKSTKSATGPWTLIGEYDISGNNIGSDIGLQYEYIENMLLNNVGYYYSVATFSKPDTILNWPSLETSINANAIEVIPGTAPPETVGKVSVVPNPYRGDIDYSSYNPAWEKPGSSRSRWMEQDRRIQFINLPAECNIRIYTLSGDLIKTIYHNDNLKGYEDWNLTSDVGQAIASDLYLFTVEDVKNSKVQIGKFVIIK